jgi:hypothetical protein
MVFSANYIDTVFYNTLTLKNIKQMKKNINTSQGTLKMSDKAKSSLNKISVWATCFAGLGFLCSFTLLILIISMKLNGIILYAKIIDSLLQITVICFGAIPSYFLLLFSHGVRKSIRTQDNAKLKEYIPYLYIAFKIFFIVFWVLMSIFLLMILMDTL